jgi:hypothetical protein
MNTSCTRHRLPDNNPLNPKYQLFIKMWKKLPLPLANLIGPHIVATWDNTWKTCCY